MMVAVLVGVGTAGGLALERVICGRSWGLLVGGWVLVRAVLVRALAHASTPGGRPALDTIHWRVWALLRAAQGEMPGGTPRCVHMGRELVGECDEGLMRWVMWLCMIIMCNGMCVASSPGPKVVCAVGLLRPHKCDRQPLHYTNSYNTIQGLCWYHMCVIPRAGGAGQCWGACASAFHVSQGFVRPVPALPPCVHIGGFLH